jgi:hypothetical protein
VQGQYTDFYYVIFPHEDEELLEVSVHGAGLHGDGLKGGQLYRGILHWEGFKNQVPGEV